MIPDAMRVELYDYIRIADEDKIKELYNIMLNDKNLQVVNWWEDEEFLADLEERNRRYEAGIDKGVTLEELEAEIEQRRRQRNQ